MGIEGNNVADAYCDKNKEMIAVEWRPDLCRKKSIDGELAQTIKNQNKVQGPFGEVLKAQVLLDLITLAKMTVSSAIETHVLTPLQKWLASHLVSEQPKLAPSYNRSGENRLIEYPSSEIDLNSYPDARDLLEESQ
jgi:hypothetical protein